MSTRRPTRPEPSAQYASANGDRRQFDRFMESNVQAQRQTGSPRSRSRSSAATSPPSSCAGWARSCATTPAAPLAPRCTRTWCCAGCATESVYEVWQELLELDLGEAGADEISDGVSCPGTDSCKLGITSSMGLNGAIQERVAQMEHRATR